MNHWTLILLVFLLIFYTPYPSNASFLKIFPKFQQLNQNSKQKAIKSDQISPSPSPAPVPNSISRDAKSPVNRPMSEICDLVSNKCHIVEYKVTACVPPLGNGSEAAYMLVVNDFASSLKLNVTVRPLDNILEDIVVAEHQVKKINLLPSVGVSSILLSTGDVYCVVDIDSVGTQGSYITPIGGTYLLFAAGLVVAGIWACCEVGKRGRRHLDGVPYRELEMGQSSVGSAEHWDQNWDGDWDEEKAVKSPWGSHLGKGSRNGSSLRYIGADRSKNGRLVQD